MGLYQRFCEEKARKTSQSINIAEFRKFGLFIPSFPLTKMYPGWYKMIEIGVKCVVIGIKLDVMCEYARMWFTCIIYYRHVLHSKSLLNPQRSR